MDQRDARAASRERARAAAVAAATMGDGAYVTPELLMRAVSDITARRNTSSPADVTMYLQRRFPMRHSDRRLLKEVERKLQIGTQHGLFVHTGYSYRLPAEREGKALNSRDLSAFWTHYHRLEREFGSDTSEESDAEAARGGGDPGRAQQAPPAAPEPPATATAEPEPQPPQAVARRRRVLRSSVARRPRCRCSRCRGRSRSRVRTRTLSGPRGSRDRRRAIAGSSQRAPRRNPPRRCSGARSRCRGRCPTRVRMLSGPRGRRRAITGGAGSSLPTPRRNPPRRNPPRRNPPRRNPPRRNPPRRRSGSRRSAFIAATAALAKWRRPQQKQKRPPRAQRSCAARPLPTCAATTLQHQGQPPQPDAAVAGPPPEPAADVAGPSNRLLMYVVLQMPPESDDGSESD